MNDLTKILFDYFKDNDIDPNKVANMIEDAKINVLDEMFGEEGEWVLKKLGSVESFDKEKNLPFNSPNIRFCRSKDEYF